MSQNKQILSYLKTHKSGLTALDALDLFNCMRLSSRIFNLKCEGHNIISEPFITRSGKSIAKYKLKR